MLFCEKATEIPSIKTQPLNVGFDESSLKQFACLVEITNFVYFYHPLFSWTLAAKAIKPLALFVTLMMFSDISVFILLIATTYLLIVYGLLRLAELFLKSNSVSPRDTKEV